MRRSFSKGPPGTACARKKVATTTMRRTGSISARRVKR